MRPRNWMVGALLLSAVGGSSLYGIGWNDAVRCTERTHSWRSAACDRLIASAVTEKGIKANAFIGRAAALFDKAETQKALADVDKGLELEPLHKAGLTLRARLLRNAGRHVDANQAWIKVLAADPFNKEIIEIVAAACKEDKSIPPAAALAACDALLDPARRRQYDSKNSIGGYTTISRSDILERRAALREKSGNVNGAIADLDETIALGILPITTRLRKAQFLLRAGQREPAIVELEKILAEKDPQYIVRQTQKTATEEMTKLVPPVPIRAGVQWQKRGIRLVAPLTIQARSGANFYMKVVDAATDEQVLTFYVPSGDNVSVTMPIGTYKIRYAAGDTWFGDKRLFGPGTRYAQLGDTHVYRQGFTYTIELILQRDGNLREFGIGADKF